MNKNLPNYLTLFRIVVIPVIIFTMYCEESQSSRLIGGALFIIASITDFFDGYLARKHQITSTFGKIFDPVADKLLIGSVILMLVRNHSAHEIPCILILAREFLVSGLREFLTKTRLNLNVSRMAKIKTFLQMTALSILIIGTTGSKIQIIDTLGNYLLWIAAILTLITGFAYLKSAIKYL